MSILEAMSSSKPVVATDVGGNKYLVQEGETGYMVPPKQPKLLAIALLKLIQNQVQARNMGSAGRQRYLQKFTVAQMVGKYELLYETILKQKAEVSAKISESNLPNTLGIETKNYFP